VSAIVDAAKRKDRQRKQQEEQKKKNTPRILRERSERNREDGKIDQIIY